jgi:tripartite-type tricarboxylate transporter receptor subunit TctC
MPQTYVVSYLLTIAADATQVVLCHDRLGTLLAGSICWRLSNSYGTRQTAAVFEDITMKLPRRQFLHLVAGAATLPTVSRSALAQSYPTRPVIMVVPFPAGGPTDAIGRVIADAMRPSLGQSVVVENVPGAAGSLGTERVALARPDGYTLGLGNTVTHVMNGAVYPLKYDIVKDFEPVSLLVKEAAIIVGRQSLPANNLRELIAWLKANPDKGLAGTGGVGTVSDVGLVFFKKQTDTSFQVVPYRGLGPAIQALLAGEVDFVMSLPANSLPQVRAGTIRAFAVAAKTRLTGAPDIPTVDEAGLEGFYQLNWHALFVPKGTPSPVIETLNAAVIAAVANPEVRRKFVGLGQDFFPAEQMTPAALAATQKAEIEQRWPIINAAGIKPE